MSTQTVSTNTITFRIGWIALLAISALAALGHIMLIFAKNDEATLFVGWAAFNLVTTALLYVPFRRGEKWTWFTAWILVIGFAAPVFFSSEQFAVFYFVAAIVMALALLLTRPAFFQKAAFAAPSLVGQDE